MPSIRAGLIVGLCLLSGSAFSFHSLTLYLPIPGLWGGLGKQELSALLWVKDGVWPSPSPGQGSGSAGTPHRFPATSPLSHVWWPSATSAQQVGWGGVWAPGCASLLCRAEPAQPEPFLFLWLQI